MSKMSVSTASLPSYHYEPQESEQRLAQRLRAARRPVGNFVKSSRSGVLALRLSGQRDDATLPVYGRGASVEGTVELSGKGMDSIQSVEVKIEGALRLKEIAESGTSTSSLCLDVKTLWSREQAHTPCPTSLSFSLTLPLTFSDGKLEYPLPPTYEAHLSGVPGFFAIIEYNVSAVVNRSKVSFFGLNNITVSTPFLYRPRSRPAVPLPGPLALNLDHPGSIYDNEQWSSSQTMMKAKSPRFEGVLAKLYLPTSRVFSISEAIPFHLFLTSSAFSLASFLPYAPLSSSSNGEATSSSGTSKHGVTRIQLLRQASVDVRGISKSHPLMRGNNTDIWKTVTAGEGVFRRYGGEGGGGHDWMAWYGELRVDKSVEVASFKASGLSVKDFILLSMTPTDPGKAPFMDLRLVVPIKLTTDPWSSEMNDEYGVGIAGYGNSSDVDLRRNNDESILNEQPDLSYGPPPFS